MKKQKNILEEFGKKFQKQENNMKEIWKQFKKACAEAWSTMVDGVKEVCRTTLSLLKDTCVAFVTGIFAWIKDVICGLCLVAWGFIKVVFAAFVAFLKAAFDLIYNKIIKWIMKW